MGDRDRERERERERERQRGSEVDRAMLIGVDCLQGPKCSTLLKTFKYSALGQ